ncbi:MAG TPA: DoxX family protein [Blastocatellia bacterium]|nr:DoxX family protein [Blastocatellia bacterium]
MLNYRAVSYAIFRITVGVMFLVYGIEKFQGGIAATAEGMTKQFGSKLPSVLVSPFAHVLPFAEVGIGVLLILGLITELGLVLAGLLMLALTFGALIGVPAAVGNNIMYSFVIFVLMWGLDNNRYSVDGLIRRKR